ncbi:hypothetical protein JET14_08740 [Martelella lutilitoris]|uniref:Uncharacterized protein n=1 Tax=Martelella lutilitoris TaxID=2583532 RepID=A0A7T7HN56_9HYPH|nr:hypothetical protein [Martelella lutilitoris]QQM32206.1 hypothetical protein JET14_08740 [Martelella lutilitoris]
MIDFTRPGSATYVDEGGVIRIAAANVPRFDFTNGRRQLLLEGPATNVLNAYAAPATLTNVAKSGQSADDAILSVVDDTEALTAAGLAELTAGKCYKLDNTAGADAANLRFLTTFDSTSPKVFSVWMRGTDGIAMRTGYGGYPVKPTTPDAYRRVSTNTAEIVVGNTNPADLLEVRVPAGCVAYVACPQVEAGLFPSSYIPTHGSAVTRPADNARLTDAVAALMQRDEASLMVQFEGLTGFVGRIVGGASYYPLLGFSGADLNVDMTTVLASGLVKPSPRAGATFTFDRNDGEVGGSYNGNAAVTASRDLLSDTAKIYLGRDENATTADRFAAGWYDQLVIWPFRMTDAALEGKAMAHA